MFKIFWILFTDLELSQELAFFLPQCQQVEVTLLVTAHGFDMTSDSPLCPSHTALLLTHGHTVRVYFHTDLAEFTMCV